MMFFVTNDSYEYSCLDLKLLKKSEVVGMFFLNPTVHRFKTVTVFDCGKNSGNRTGGTT